MLQRECAKQTKNSLLFLSKSNIILKNQLFCIQKQKYPEFDSFKKAKTP